MTDGPSTSNPLARPLADVLRDLHTESVLRERAEADRDAYHAEVSVLLELLHDALNRAEQRRLTILRQSKFIRDFVDGPGSRRRAA
jgi:hypothetical protein